MAFLRLSRILLIFSCIVSLVGTRALLSSCAPVAEADAASAAKLIACAAAAMVPVAFMVLLLRARIFSIFSFTRGLGVDFEGLGMSDAEVVGVAVVLS